MLSNIKAFYKERNIDISDTISMMKQTKKNASGNGILDKQIAKVYWQLAMLIFSAFYLDHS
jgi:hypothetical protein